MWQGAAVSCRMPPIGENSYREAGIRGLTVLMDPVLVTLCSSAIYFQPQAGRGQDDQPFGRY